jgi:hypothetical protein
MFSSTKVPNSDQKWASCFCMERVAALLPSPHPSPLFRSESNVMFLLDAGNATSNAMALILFFAP